MIVSANINSSISFLQMLNRQYVAPGKKPLSSQKYLLDTIQKTDPEKADALKKKLDDAEHAIVQLRSGKSHAAQSRKAAAAQKIKRIKEEIQILLRMGGDPKVIARKIAKLSKELAAAAHDYASSDGVSYLDNPAGANAETNMSNNNTNNSNHTLSATTQSDSAAGGAAASPAVSMVMVADQPDASGEKGENNESGAPDVRSQSQINIEQNKSIQQYQEGLQQQAKTYWQNKSDELTQKISATKANQEFAREVRTLAALLKMLARQQKQRLSEKGDHSADREIAQTNQALAEVEKSLSSMETPAISRNEATP
jgi:hypothetical protein